MLEKYPFLTETVILSILLPLLILPIAVVAIVIKTKNRKNPLYWIDRLATAIVKAYKMMFQR